MQLFLKPLSGMANSLDPDQEQSDLGLHCLHKAVLSETLVYEILRHLFYISLQLQSRSRLILIWQLCTRDLIYFTTDLQTQQITARADLFLKWQQLNNLKVPFLQQPIIFFTVSYNVS